MKKLITTTSIILFAVSAYAADEKADSMQNGMKAEDMMENCQHHMKDGKMMDSMPKDMVAQCQEMMHDGSGAVKSGSTKTDAPKAGDSADHKAHHPAQ